MGKEGRRAEEGRRAQGDRRERRPGPGQGKVEEEDLLAGLIERLARELLALPAAAWGDDDDEE